MNTLQFDPRKRVAVYRRRGDGQRDEKPYRCVAQSLAHELFESGYATILWASRRKRTILGLLDSKDAAYAKLFEGAKQGTAFVACRPISTSPSGIWTHKESALIRYRFSVVPQGRKVA